MTAPVVTIAQLEALRTVALAAVTSCQGVLQTIESMIIAGDRVEPTPNPWGTFDDAPADVPTPGGRSDGRKAKR